MHTIAAVCMLKMPSIRLLAAVNRMVVSGSLRQVPSSWLTADCVVSMNSTASVSMTGRVFTRQWSSRLSA